MRRASSCTTMPPRLHPTRCTLCVCARVRAYDSIHVCVFANVQRGRGRDRQRERQTERQTDRETDRQRDRERETVTETETETETERKRQIYIERHRNRYRKPPRNPTLTPERAVNRQLLDRIHHAVPEAGGLRVGRHASAIAFVPHSVRRAVEVVFAEPPGA